MFLRFLFAVMMIAGATSYVDAQDQSRSDNSPVKAVDQKVKILEKPRAAYPTSGTGTVCIQGSVRLKVTFLSTGEIGTITPITRLPYGLTENALEAAKKIKFVPAIKDGKAVTTVATVDYSFTIY